MQGVRWCGPLHAQMAEEQIQRVRWFGHLHTQAHKAQLQGVRWCRHLHTWVPAPAVQGVRWCECLPAWAAKEGLQGVRWCGTHSPDLALFHSLTHPPTHPPTHPIYRQITRIRLRALRFQTLGFSRVSTGNKNPGPSKILSRHHHKQGTQGAEGVGCRGTSRVDAEAQSTKECRATFSCVYLFVWLCSSTRPMQTLAHNIHRLIHHRMDMGLRDA